jgi:hypothetical protein
MLSKRVVTLSCCLCLLITALKVNGNSNGEMAKAVGEVDLEGIALHFMSMIELKLKQGRDVSQYEVRLMAFLLNEIHKRIEAEREKNTVYWLLRQG